MSDSSDRYRELYDIDPDTLRRVRRFGELLDHDELVLYFYTWLAEQPEYARFFRTQGEVDRVRGLQAGYWRQFWCAVEIDDAYIASRQHVGAVHARIQLPLRIYFAAMMRVYQQATTPPLYDFSLGAAEFALTLQAINRLMSLDTALVADAYEQHTAQVRLDMEELVAMLREVEGTLSGIRQSKMYERVQSTLAGQPPRLRS